MVQKIDSNVTGLRFAEETSLGVLPGSPVWYPLEPNSYSDYGSDVTTVARRPINASRQRKKGASADLDASGGFNQDLTFSNTTRLMQGILFADIREKVTTAPMNAAAVPITAVATSDDSYAVAGYDGDVLANHLVLASGFSIAGNNGLKTSDAVSAAGKVTVAENLTDETPPADAKLQVVGYMFASGTVDITLNGDLVRITRVSGAVDLTTLGLIPGEFVFVGGDTSSLRFTNNQGFGRVHEVAATYIEFDKVSWTPAAEVGTAKTVQIFFGDIIKNENDPDLIVTRTYNVERTLGNDGVGVQSEYLVGAVANEATINVTNADKVNIDISFIATDNEQRDGTTGVKSGDRPDLPAEDCYNTSTDFYRIKLALFTGLDAAPAPLFAYATELTLTINNNASPAKAIGVLGAFDVQIGGFDVGGSMNAYFATVDAVQAVRDNEDVTLDLILTKNNSGLLFDVPLIALGGGRLNVEQDQAITLPLDTEAAEGDNHHTLLFNSFNYLPDLAE